MPLSGPQLQIANSTARFRVVAAGRRGGKTFLMRREMCQTARHPEQKVWYVAPTYRMGTDLMWEPLVEKLDRLRWIRKVNNQSLTVVLRSGSTISIKSADNPDRLRGPGLTLVVFDEAADIKEETWTKVIRPTLSDTGGRAIFVGTPKGRNWFYDLFMRGIEGRPGWWSLSYTSLQGGNVPASEIEQAKLDLDELTFQQEYEASFVNFSGRVYYPFARETHCRPLQYNPRRDLIFCFDFNVEPGVAVVCQEQSLPGQQRKVRVPVRRMVKGQSQVVLEVFTEDVVGTGVIGEVHIPRNSNTPAVCRKLIADWGGHQGNVFVYGDATGGARGSAKVEGSDWELVYRILRGQFEDRLFFVVPTSNPPERARVNAVNSRLRSMSGDIRLVVDPARAPHVVRDLEGVQILLGGSGEIDKRADPALTHISDALGYYVVQEFPVHEVEAGSVSLFRFAA